MSSLPKTKIFSAEVPPLKRSIQRNKKLYRDILKIEKDNAKSITNFIFSSGISIYSLIMLHSCGILNILEKSNQTTLENISNHFPNINLIPIKSALLSLTFTNILKYENSIFKLTPL